MTFCWPSLGSNNDRTVFHNEIIHCWWPRCRMCLFFSVRLYVVLFCCRFATAMSFGMLRLCRPSCSTLFWSRHGSTTTSVDMPEESLRKKQKKINAIYQYYSYNPHNFVCMILMTKENTLNFTSWVILCFFNPSLANLLAINNPRKITQRNWKRNIIIFPTQNPSG